MRILTPCFIMVGILVWPGMGSAATPSMPVEVIFNDPIEDNNFASRGWFDNTNQVLSNNGAIPGSTQSIDWTWAKGATKPPNGSAMRHGVSDTDNVYISYYVRYKSGWEGSNRAYHPHEFYFTTNKNDDYTGLQGGLSGNLLSLYVEQNELTPRVVYANVDNPSNGNEVLYDGTSTMALDTWYHVEAFFKMNTYTGSSANSDGIIKYWLDGVLEVDVSNALMRDGASNSDMLINNVIFAPWLGDGSPVEQTMWVDDLTVGTENLNAGGTTPKSPSSISVD